MSVGVVGLGNMGGRIARRLVDGGEEVVGFDLSVADCVSPLLPYHSACSIDKETSSILPTPAPLPPPTATPDSETFVLPLCETLPFVVDSLPFSLSRPAFHFFPHATSILTLGGPALK